MNHTQNETDHRHRRSDAERISDMEFIADLLNRGYSEWEAHAELNKRTLERGGYCISERQFQDDVALVMAGWMNKTLLSVGEAAASELSKTARLLKAYWDGFLGSKGSLVASDIDETSTDQVAFGPGQISDLKRTKRRKTSKWSPGDQRWLDGIERLLEFRAKLLGLFDRANLDWRVEAKNSGLDDTAIANTFEEIVKLYSNEIAKRQGQSQGGDPDAPQPEPVQ